MKHASHALLLGMALAAAPVVACGSDSSGAADAGGPTEDAAAATGELSVHVLVPDGAAVGAIGYSIAGPTPAQGETSVADAGADFFVAGLAPGDYAVQLSAVDGEGDGCTGSSPFVITAGALTGISIDLQCGAPPDAMPPPVVDSGGASDAAFGSVAVEAGIDVVSPPPQQCPGINAFSVTPAALPVGSQSAVSASTVPAGVDAALRWTSGDATGQVGAGTFADPSSATTTFQCTRSGQVTVTASVGVAACAGQPFTTMSAVVTCQ